MKKGIIKKNIVSSLLTVSMFCTCSQIPVNARVFYDKLEKTYQNYYSSPHLKDKHQHINGPCWAFANIATLETLLAKKGMLKNNCYLSEKHLLNYVNQSQNNNGLHVPITNGGYNSFSNAYFMSGKGPVFEYECPYDTNNTHFNSSFASIKPKYWVKGIKNVNKDIDSIKKAVSEYGAVTSSYNAGTGLFHAVSIVGWDDNKRSWIVKDSSNRCNYTDLPFSTDLSNCACITDVDNFPSNLKIHQHDEYMITGSCCCNNSPLIVANVFEFNQNEKLTNVTLYSEADKASVKIYYAPLDNYGKPTTSKNLWSELYSGIIPHKGYFTLDLKNKKTFYKKSKGAIIAKIEKNGHSVSPSIGYQSSDCEYLTLPPYQPGKSFIWHRSNFADPKNTLSLSNFSGFSIKAITRTQ